MLLAYTTQKYKKTGTPPNNAPVFLILTKKLTYQSILSNQNLFPMTDEQTLCGLAAEFAAIEVASAVYNDESVFKIVIID